MNKKDRKREEGKEFQYFLSDKETVVNFDAPTDVLQEYLNETNDLIALIRARVENLHLQANLDPRLKEDEDYNYQLRNAKRALGFKFGLKSRLVAELKAREGGKIAKLKQTIVAQADLIVKQRRIVKKVTGLSIEKLSKINPEDTEKTSALLKMVYTAQEKDEMIKKKDEIIQNQRSHLAELDKVVAKLKEESDSSKDQFIKNLQQGIANRDAVIQELLELDNASLKEIRIALRNFKKMQQENKKQD